MEFFDFEQADTTYQLPNADHDSELANLFASMSPSAHEMDFFSEEVRAQCSLDDASPGSPSPVDTEANILGSQVVPASETAIQGDGLIVSGILNAKINKACRRSFSREAVKILRCWLQDHAEHPYPDPKEKEVLQTKTGLRKDQVSNWLANARRRDKGQRGQLLSPQLTSPISCNSLMDSSITVPMQIPGRGSDSCHDSNPLDRWRLSPSEQEPASASAISNAIAASSSQLNEEWPSSAKSREQPNYSTSFGSASRAPSVSSLETARSSGSESSFSSMLSRQSSTDYSVGSGQSGTSQAKETRRRRRTPAITRRKLQRDNDKRPYECTFCTDSFKTKYDWQRHEKSLHLSLESWQCTPHGPTQNGGTSCAFCGHLQPDGQHLESHNYIFCAEQPAQERTFYRKDHLTQHLRLAHNECKFHAPTMESWISFDHEIRSRCGFCDARLMSWTERVEHLAAHFKQAKTMNDWVGEHDFEPYVEQFVQHSISPWLIVMERKTLDPFSASNASHVIQAPRQSGFTSGTYSVHHLDEQLGAFVKTQAFQGHVPTDKEIQNHARILVYEYDDPWNQTRADLPMWLDQFKKKVGLITVSAAHGLNAYIGDDGRVERYKSSRTLDGLG